VVVIVSNLTPKPLAIDVTGLAAAAVRSRMLDARSVERASDDPIAWRSAGGEWITAVDGAVRVELGPYAVVRFDTGA
jgi:hypothetical protein